MGPKFAFDVKYSVVLEMPNEPLRHDQGGVSIGLAARLWPQRKKAPTSDESKQPCKIVRASALEELRMVDFFCSADVLRNMASAKLARRSFLSKPSNTVTKNRDFR